MENLLFAAPQRKHATKRKKSKKGKVRIIHITTIKYRVFRKTLRKKKKSKIFPTHVWFTDGSEKDYYIKYITPDSFEPKSKYKISQINIGNAVTSIGDDTFNGCDSMTIVTIPDSVTYIGPRAFYCCRRLTSVTIPDSVKDIGDKAFHGCSFLASVTIGTGVENIGENVFNDCDNLTCVSILGKTMAQVKGMVYYSFGKFGLKSGAVIQCKDGNIYV